MQLTAANFDRTLDKKINKINDFYPYADNFELARMDADINCLKCMKEKGFEFINNNKSKINDCNSKFLEFNSLSWEELINKKSRRSKRRYK